MSSDFLIVIPGSIRVKFYHLFLFSLYINDKEKYLIEKGIGSLESFSKDIEDDVCIFLKLFVFFFAGDTAILFETPSDLQHALNNIFVYFET